MDACECMKECKCLTFQIGECDYCEERKCEYCEQNLINVIIDDI